MAKQYKVGIYCRLSVDDASNSAKAKGYIPSDESVSIENQDGICQGYFHPLKMPTLFIHHHSSRFLDF